MPWLRRVIEGERNSREATASVLFRRAAVCRDKARTREQRCRRSGSGAKGSAQRWRSMTNVSSAYLSSYCSRSNGRSKPTHASRLRFSQRTTGPPWNLTFADAAGQIKDGDSSRSRMPADDLDNFGAERLHPMVTTWRCRPAADIHQPTLSAAKLTLRQAFNRTWVVHGARAPACSTAPLRSAAGTPPRTAPCG